MKLPRAAVAQEHSMGCAVACVAYRSSTSYQQALSYFSHQEYAWTRGYYCAEVVEALGVAGYRYSFEKYKACRHSARLKIPGTIVFVDPCARFPAGHYIIRSAEGWMNSWITFPKIVNVEADFQTEVPGKVGYIIFEKWRHSRWRLTPA